MLKLNLIGIILLYIIDYVISNDPKPIALNQLIVEETFNSTFYTLELDKLQQKAYLIILVQPEDNYKKYTDANLIFPKYYNLF